MTSAYLISYFPHLAPWMLCFGQIGHFTNSNLPSMSFFTCAQNTLHCQIKPTSWKDLLTFHSQAVSVSLSLPPPTRLLLGPLRSWTLVDMPYGVESLPVYMSYPNHIRNSWTAGTKSYISVFFKAIVICFDGYEISSDYPDTFIRTQVQVILNLVQFTVGLFSKIHVPGTQTWTFCYIWCKVYAFLKNHPQMNLMFIRG